MSGKFIQRYAHVARSVPLGAGVYSGTTSVVHKVQFNLIVNSLQFRINIIDSVTSQALSGRVFLRFVPLSNTKDYRANPGIDLASGEIVPSLVTRDGRNDELKLHCPMTSGETLMYSYIVYLSQVTANIINTVNYLTVGYLCPEDYMSVGAFAAEPL